jgi:hypothetical protein
VGSGRGAILLDSEDEREYLTGRFSVQTVLPFSQRREEPSLGAFLFPAVRGDQGWRELAGEDS